MNELTKDILKSIDSVINHLHQSLRFNYDPFHFNYLKWQAQQSPIDCEGYQPMSTVGLRGEPPRKP